MAFRTAAARPNSRAPTKNNAAESDIGRRGDVGGESLEPARVPTMVAAEIIATTPEREGAVSDDNSGDQAKPKGKAATAKKIASRNTLNRLRIHASLPLDLDAHNRALHRTFRHGRLTGRPLASALNDASRDVPRLSWTTLQSAATRMTRGSARSGTSFHNCEKHPAGDRCTRK